MLQKDEEYLYAKYPKLFAQRSLPVTQSALGWGCQCGSGWLAILDRLCSKIQALVDSKKIPQFEFTTIKEKLGTLHVYPPEFDNEVGDLLEQAEQESKRTCEICGSKENVECKARTWYIQALCKKCEIEYLKERE